jgi:hypothetical protein
MVPLNCLPLAPPYAGPPPSVLGAWRSDSRDVKEMRWPR